MKIVFPLKPVALMLCLLCSIGTVAQEAYTVLTEADSTLTFYYDEMRGSRPGTSYSLNTGLTSPDWYRSRHKVSRAVFDPSFAAARPKSTFGWFYEMDNLTSITGIAYLNTSSVTYMTFMFSGCKSLDYIDLSGFDTSGVTDMMAMFQDCTSLTTLDVSGFNTENVTNLGSMFANCESLTLLDVSGFNTDNVVDMAAMFQDCRSLTALDVSGFNTGNVTDIYGMFNGCNSLKSIDVSGFNTANVTNMRAMFALCSSLTTLDLSGFNTENVTDMYGMFNGCNLLETICVGLGWCTDAVTESGMMFRGCTHLVGGQGTTYDADHVDVTYAHVDGGPSNPGYLTCGFNENDVNGDGEVNIADVNTIINSVLGNGCNSRADLNKDGEINIADINAIIDIILGDGCSR
ncbi:MAG: BspA family leucine-rich repeat surface protein [Muribaculaceae bacterium]|nr:BspA family leucine-rich repeat surface protein [Muribaculaceae bacterium]